MLLFGSYVLTLSICVSEPVSMLASLCHTEQTATVVGALKRRKRVKKMWLTTYKAVACIRSVARQTNGGESHMTNVVRMELVHE